MSEPDTDAAIARLRESVHAEAGRDYRGGGSMSAYRILADAATPRPWDDGIPDAHGVDDLGTSNKTEIWCLRADEKLACALVNDLNAIERLWWAADKIQQPRGTNAYPMFTSDFDDLNDAVEALRRRFEETDLVVSRSED